MSQKDVDRGGGRPAGRPYGGGWSFDKLRMSGQLRCGKFCRVGRGLRGLVADDEILHFAALRSE